MIDPELLEEFAIEAQEHLAHVEESILALEQSGAEVAPEIVNQLFRSLHTVKGSAGILEFDTVSSLAHAMENVVGRLRNGEMAPNPQMVDDLLVGKDQLRELLTQADVVVDATIDRLRRWLADGETPAAEAAPVVVPPVAEEEAGPVEAGPTTAVDASATKKVAHRAPARGVAEEPGEHAVRIPLALLDKLMNLASELVLVRNQNVQAATARDVEQLIAVSQRLNVVTSELQASVMQTRMRPIGSIFTKFHRVVRDLAHKLGKEIEIDVVGAEVELDKTIVETINDPLVHLIRNAVDHGIESPGERERLGKPLVGRLRLSAFHQAGQVNIQIQDDGRGMDPGKLRATAVAKGLLRADEAEDMADHETYNLVFLPGFSTAADVSDLSGRGVGLDVVKSSFQRLGGTIELVSQVGRGTTITIRLPLTLAIVPTLIVGIDAHSFAIPQANIDEVVWVHGTRLDEEIERVDDREVYWLRGQLLPVLRLSDVLQLATAPRTEADRSVYIIVLRLGAEQFGLLVDTIIDTEEIVVKPLHQQLKDCGAFVGTTVLGDGRIAMILDIAAVAEIGRLRFSKMEEKVGNSRSSVDEQRTVLLFDLGGREQFAIPLCLITRVEEVKPGAIQLANDREYLRFRENLVPLVRVEQVLPRVTTAYRDDLLYAIIPKCYRPFGILASSIRDAVEVPADIDTRTVSMPGILGTQIIGGRLTLFIDSFAAIEALEPTWFAALRHGGLKRILLVEDSPFSRFLIQSYLKGTGIDLTVVTNGREALERLAVETFDGIISDLEMPVMNGYEFARAVRKEKRYADLPLIAVSSAESEVRPLALDAGFDDFRPKTDRKGLVDTMTQFTLTGRFTVAKESP